MNPITDILNQEENSRARLFAQYQMMLQTSTANRPVEPVREPANAENGADEEDGEDSASPDNERRDRWIPSEEDDEGVDESAKSPYRLAHDAGAAPAGNGDTSEEDEDLIRRLQARDREVRQHEQAHAAALGMYAGVISYTYQIGPDGHAYAIGGSTEIRGGSDASPEGERARARAIRTAASATSEPSAADQAAGTQAMIMERDANARLIGSG